MQYITNLLVVFFIYIESKIRYCHILKVGSFRPILNVTRPGDFFSLLVPLQRIFSIISGPLLFDILFVLWPKIRPEV